MSLTRLPLFPPSPSSFFLLHLLSPLHLFHRLLIVYHLAALCRYLDLLRVRGLNWQSIDVSCVPLYAEYAPDLDASRFMYMRAGDRALTVFDRHSVLFDSVFGAWGKRWLECGGCDMSVSHSIGFKRCSLPRMSFPVVYFYRNSVCIVMASWKVGSSLRLSSSQPVVQAGEA